MDKYVYWINFVVGLGTFAGFVLVARSVIRSTPDSLDTLTETIKEQTAHIDLLVQQIDRQDKSRNDKLSKVLGMLTDVNKMCHDLKYQHDHPENFNFGTEKTEVMLGEVRDMLVTIKAVIRAS